MRVHNDGNPGKPLPTNSFGKKVITAAKSFRVELRSNAQRALRSRSCTQILSFSSDSDSGFICLKSSWRKLSLKH